MADGPMMQLKCSRQHILQTMKPLSQTAKKNDCSKLRSLDKDDEMNETVTSSDINVAIDRPTSWYLCWLPTGPSWMKMKRVGTQTSVSSANRIAFCRRMNATSGSVKQSTSPTRIFDASAPGGIFFKKCSLNYKHTVSK